MTNYYKFADVMREFVRVGYKKTWVYRQLPRLSHGVRGYYSLTTGPLVIERKHIEELLTFRCKGKESLTDGERESILATRSFLLPEDIPKRANKSGTVAYQHRMNQVAIHKAAEIREMLLSLAGATCGLCGKTLVDGGRHAQFHHRVPETKCFPLSGKHLSSRSIYSIMEEYEKCDLLCAHCHQEAHKQLRKEKKNEPITLV